MAKSCQSPLCESSRSSSASREKERGGGGRKRVLSSFFFIFTISKGEEKRGFGNPLVFPPHYRERGHGPRKRRESLSHLVFSFTLLEKKRKRKERPNCDGTFSHSPQGGKRKKGTKKKKKSTHGKLGLSLRMSVSSRPFLPRLRDGKKLAEEKEKTRRERITPLRRVVLF